MSRYSIPLTNGQHEIGVSDVASILAPFHQLALSYDVAPAAGTISIEYRLVGDNVWRPLEDGQTNPIIGGFALSYYGMIEAYRFTIAGVSGGSGLKVWIADAQCWIGPGFPEGAWEGLRALTVQNYTEANVKNGVQYQVSAYTAELAVGANIDYVVVTGSKPIAVKGRAQQWDGVGIRLETYFNPEYTGGTTLPYYNFNLMNPVAGEAQIIVGMTLSGIGTKCAADKTLLGSSGTGNSVLSSTSSDTPGIETILAPNSKYLFRTVGLHTTGVQRVAGFTTWYEGGLDLPRT